LTRDVAKRIQIANAKARANPNMQLGARTLSALAVLRKSTRLLEIMSAVITLETATQLSQACCLCFVRAEAPQALFSLIQTCNRSLPHVELLYYILRALNNVGKHDTLLVNVTPPESADIFIDLLQFHRDQEKIIDLAALLLYRGVRSTRQFRVSHLFREIPFSAAKINISLTYCTLIALLRHRQESETFESLFHVVHSKGAIAHGCLPPLFHHRMPT
jgi:hypothetical protein